MVKTPDKDTNVPTKTPDEIKKGLECCKDDTSCGKGTCPYRDSIGSAECIQYMAGDAFAYITQLEQRLARVERERDAAVEALDDIRHCDCCKHYAKTGGEEPCFSCDMLRKPNYEWRGVCEENSNE